MTDPMKPIFADMADRFGLGSSTRGKTMDEHNRGRTEAEFRAERAARPKISCYAGETFEQAEARLFLEARDAFNEAIQEARRIVEQIGLPPFRDGQSAADYFDAVIADFVGDTWADDPRAEDDNG